MDAFEQDIKRAITQLTAFDHAVAAALPKAAAAGAKVLRAEAEHKAPIRSGKLKASAFDEPVDHDVNEASHKVGFDTFYALPVDRGHPVRTQRGGPVVGRAAAVRFMSDPVARLRKTRIAKLVTKTVQDEVAKELARFYK